MSYILEALKKSDRERKQGKVPTLETIPEPIRTRRRNKQPLWPFALIGILLLVGAVLLTTTLYRPEPPAAPTAIPETAAVAPLAPPLPAEEPPASTPAAAISEKTATAAIPAGNVEATSAPAISPPRNNPEALNETGNIATTESAPPQAAGLTSEEETAAPAEEDIPEEAVPTETIAADRPEDELAPPPADEGEAPLVELEDMSAASRQELPEIKIGVHLYSDNPAGRRASVNGRLLKEGDQAGPGLYLVEITRRGAIFSYRGKKFSIPVLPY